jgi:DNA-binding NtrC family response regulator
MGCALDLLLVEDEPQVAQMLIGRLARVGFSAEWVTSVPAAVGALLQRPYTVVLLDILLKQGGGRPSQDGLDVAREMRRRGIDTPLVVMTGFATFEHGVHAGSLTPAAVIAKERGPKSILRPAKQQQQQQQQQQQRSRPQTNRSRVRARNWPHLMYQRTTRRADVRRFCSEPSGTRR